MVNPDSPAFKLSEKIGFLLGKEIRSLRMGGIVLFIGCRVGDSKPFPPPPPTKNRRHHQDLHLPCNLQFFKKLFEFYKINKSIKNLMPWRIKNLVCLKDICQ